MNVINLILDQILEISHRYNSTVILISVIITICGISVFSFFTIFLIPCYNKIVYAERREKERKISYKDTQYVNRVAASVMYVVS